MGVAGVSAHEVRGYCSRCTPQPAVVRLAARIAAEITTLLRSSCILKSEGYLRVCRILHGSLRPLSSRLVGLVQTETFGVAACSKGRCKFEGSLSA